MNWTYIYFQVLQTHTHTITFVDTDEEMMIFLCKSWILNYIKYIIHVPILQHITFLLIYSHVRFFFLLTVLDWDGDTLEVSKISRLDMGAYLCIASNGVPPSISKRIKVSVDCKYTDDTYFSHFFSNMCQFYTWDWLKLNKCVYMCQWMYGLGCLMFLLQY